MTLERGFNPKRRIKSKIDGCGGIFFFDNLPVLMEIVMSTCQGKKAGLLQRKTAGASEPVQVRKPCEEAARGRASSSLMSWPYPLSPRPGKDAEGTAIPRKRMKTHFMVLHNVGRSGSSSDHVPVTVQSASPKVTCEASP